jgi:hypothetical protein
MWSNNNAACRYLWLALRSMGELDAVFADAGAIKMSGLMSWNAQDSAKIRRMKARGLATQLHFFFRNVAGARGEQDVTEDQAIQAALDVLVQAAMTVADLGQAVDTSYRFLEEIGT